MTSDIGGQIRELRKKRGLTQSQLAERAGIHRVTLNQIERNRSGTTVDTLERILGALGAPALAERLRPSASHERKPNSFYEDVVRVYRQGRRHRSAERLAAHFDVPSTTIQRWLKEARRRGLLELARDADCERCGLPASAHPPRSVIPDTRDGCVALLRRVLEMNADWRAGRIEWPKGTPNPHRRAS